MSPLAKGPGSIRANVNELVNSDVVSQARHKAIMTIARKNNISYEQAQMKQAIAIAKSQARKR